MSSCPLKIENLVKSYGSLCAVDDVSFEVRPGEIFGLLGPNGAGKTSLISTIVTLEEPTSGRVMVFDKDVQQEPQYTKSLVGVVPQEIVNHGFFNMMEIMRFHSGYYGLSNNKDRIEELVKRMGLWDHRFKKVKQMSGGMKRRLLIAKALVHKPKLLLLDEPTAGVDIELRASLWEFVKELKEQGTSILLTTHYLEEAEELCDRVGVIHKGQLLKVENTQRLIEELTFRNVSILGSDFKPFEHPNLLEYSKTQIKLKIPSDTHVGGLLNEIGLPLKSINDIRIQEGSLEEAFRWVIGQNGGER